MNVFRINFDGKPSGHYYGKLRLAANKYRRVKLMRVDNGKRESIVKLNKIQAEHDRTHGLSTRVGQQAAMAISVHVENYLRNLETQTSNADHVGISRSTLARLVKAAGWTVLADISSDSALLAITSIAATQSYRNQYLKRLRAFVRWCMDTDRLFVSPIRGLKRFNERGAKRNRARRAATRVEIDRLFSVDLPVYRRLAYALAICNGLRRNEIARLERSDIDQNAAVPFIRIRQKMGEGFDVVPIHPYVSPLFSDEDRVPIVPDVKTLKKDLAKADVKFTIDGKRLDFHALRHTFATELDRAHASRATKKKLLRHAASDITDGYTHAELTEAREALLRVHSPVTRQVDQKPDQNFVELPAFVGDLSHFQVGEILRGSDDLATLTEFALKSVSAAGYPSGNRDYQTSRRLPKQIRAFYGLPDQKLDRHQRAKINGALVRLRALHAQGRINGDAYSGLALLAADAPRLLKPVGGTQ